MTAHDDTTHTAQRRNFVKAVGAAAAGSVALTAPAAALDDALSLDGTVEEAIVVFESNDVIDGVLADVDLDVGVGFSVLPMAYVEATGDALESLADRTEVLRVSANYELEYHNDDSLEHTNSAAVHAGDDLDASYTGDNAAVAVIDSGVDPLHPDLEENVEANYQYVGVPNVNEEPLFWEDVGDVMTDDNGHGTHCSGSVAGDGTESDGEYRGMAPDADLHVYGCSGGAVLLVYIVSAYDDLIRRQREGAHEIHVTSNSYGPLEDDRPFVVDDPMNVATWYAHEEGMLPLYSAGNDGPDPGTLSQYGKAPHVLAVAAADDEQAVADFSSRARPQDGSWDHDNYDREAAYENLTSYYSGTPESEIDGPLGIYRNGVIAKGDSVMSTINPAHPLGALEPDDELWYSYMSGTSMSCPTAAGVAALVVDAYVENHGEAPDPTAVLSTLEATAVGDAHDEYDPVNAGTGYVDAQAAVAAAEDGDLAGFDDVDLAGE